MVERLMNTLKKIPFEAYVVGGAVRDAWLGIEPKDIDICSPLDVIEMKVIAQKNAIPWYITTELYDMMVLIIDGEHIECTQFRKDIKTDGRHATTIATRHLIDDLARRDFTMNAMAIDTDGNRIDPFNGNCDLGNGIIACVGDPARRFTEDRLRIIRGLRFQARFGFDIAPRTAKAMQNMAATVFDSVSVERVVMEIEKAFSYSGEAAANFLNNLWSYGILDHILPEMTHMHLLNHNPEYHSNNALFHTFDAVRAAEPRYRWHALLHDIGKPSAAVMDDVNTYYHFYEHEVVGAKMIPEIAERLKLSNELRDSIIATTRYHMQPMFAKSPHAIRRFQANAGTYLEDIKQVHIADSGDRREPNLLAFLPQPEVVLHEHIVTGLDLLYYWRIHNIEGADRGKMMQIGLDYQIDEGITDKDEIYTHIIKTWEAS